MDDPLIAIRHYVDARMDDHARLHAADALALRAAVDTLASRFQSVDESRATLSDQAGHFVTRAEMDGRLVSLADKLDAVAALATRSAIAAGVAGGVLGLLGGALVARVLG